MYPTQEIRGDLSVSHSLSTGGHLRIGGAMRVKGDVKIEGLLDAPNIVGPCKGAFRSLEELAKVWPKPVNGWWAIVGGIPGTPVFGYDGLWSLGGGKVGAEILQVYDYNERLDSLETQASDSSAKMDRMESMTENVAGRITALETSEAQTRENVATISDDLLERRPVGTPVTVVDHCAGLGEGTAQYARSNFSGFANVAGTLSRAVDTLEVPVLAADWEGNTTPLSSVLVVLRSEGPEGAILYSKLIPFTPIPPGQKRTLSLRLSDTPLMPAGTVWLEMHFNAPCTLYFCNGPGQGDTTVPGRYYIAGRQSSDDHGWESVGHTTWWYIVYRLISSGAMQLGLNDRTVEDIGRRLQASGSLPGGDTPATAPSGAEIPSLRLPSEIVAVRGDTLQLFYRGMIKDSDPYRHRPMLQGSVGKAYPRYWEFTPDATAPTSTPLTLVCRAADGTVTASASTTLRVVPPPTSPSAPLHVVCIGDSLTASGVWPREVRRRLCATGGNPAGLGLSNIRFYGARSADDTAWTGFSGWQWADFVGPGKTDNPNPLYSSALGRISFKAFADEFCEGRIDVVYVLLGWNSMAPLGKDLSGLLSSLKTFARRLHEDFPNARMRLMGLQMPSPDGGTGHSYGAAPDGYADAHGLALAAHRLNETYAQCAASDEFAPWMRYLEVAAQFDSDYCMPRAETPVNVRSTVTETLGVNGVHPSTEGYLQIADAVFRDLAYIVL